MDIRVVAGVLSRDFRLRSCDVRHPTSNAASVAALSRDQFGALNVERRRIRTGVPALSHRATCVMRSLPVTSMATSLDQLR